MLYQTLPQAGAPWCQGGQRRRARSRGGLIAIADAGVGTAAALLVGWRCLCGGKKKERGYGGHLGGCLHPSLCNPVQSEATHQHTLPAQEVHGACRI